MIDNEFCDDTLASVNGQKFNAYKVIVSSASIFFKKNTGEKNHHPSIFMRGINN